METRDLILASARPSPLRIFEIRELGPLVGHIRRGVTSLTPELQLLEVLPSGEKKGAPELEVLAHLNDQVVGTHVTDAKGKIRGKAFSFSSSKDGVFSISLPGRDPLFRRATAEMTIKNFDEQRQQKLKRLGQRTMMALYRAWVEYQNLELSIALKSPLEDALQVVRGFILQHKEMLERMLCTGKEIADEMKFISSERIPYLATRRFIIILRLRECFLISGISLEAENGEIPEKFTKTETPAGKVMETVFNRLKAEIQACDEEIEARKKRMETLKTRMGEKKKQFFTDQQHHAATDDAFLVSIEKAVQAIRAIDGVLKETEKDSKSDRLRHQSAKKWNGALGAISKGSESLHGVITPDFPTLFSQAHIYELPTLEAQLVGKIKPAAHGQASSCPEQNWKEFVALAKQEQAFLQRHEKVVRNIEKLFQSSLFH